MDVVVISRETIKPSSPTPHHLRSFKLSLIDQYTIPKFYVPLILFKSAEGDCKQCENKRMPDSLPEIITDTNQLSNGVNNNHPVDYSDNSVDHLDAQVEGQLNQVLTSPAFYIPLILFYPADGDCDKFRNTKMSDQLKKSLSEALTKFYPLGGRIHSNHSIDCNDNGVEYLEALVRGEFNQVLSCPNANELNDLLPCDVHCNGGGFRGLLAVQVNIFDCGGIAISVCVSHIPSDAMTLCTFINSWSGIARGANTIVSPKFDSASLFPPREVPSIPMIIKDGCPMEKFISKRFVFDALKIAALRAKLADESCVECPTRVEAVSALIWKCLMNVVRLAPRSLKSYILNLTVNLRSRMSPPLPPHSFGNLVMGALSPASTAESNTELNFSVGQLRKSIQKIDGQFLHKLQLDDAKLMLDHLKNEREHFLKEDVEAYIFTSGKVLFTSWCRFPCYKADFGWGEPTWVTSVNLILKNCVTLMDTKNGDGIEAWVTLDEEDMAVFECEQELLSFACQNRMAYQE
ncbi:hypothetical protein IFM89_020011 [Coptis chinensis]|uniref:Uncharacterized protein n=1 Tax=Coptis chinensis TaxID=261450 RepID=A0A835M9G8_9MAGN|nr:hypothetical protein IFM89_020011 [Coptis chinensis]